MTYALRGSRQMPAGVWSPTATAASVDADTKSKRSGTRDGTPHYAISTLLDRDEEWADRKRLMERARKGDQAAHAELWAKYRCTLEVGA